MVKGLDKSMGSRSGQFIQQGQQGIANMWAVYRRELYSYFRSPLAYVIVGIFWLVGGLLFISVLIGNIENVALNDYLQTQGDKKINYDSAYLFLQSFLETVLGSISLLVLPLLSMGLYAEERKQGTLEMLVTSPIANWQVAVGKLLGALTIFGLMILPFLGFEMLAVAGSKPAFPPMLIWMGHGALMLQAAAILAWGMWISACSSSSIAAAFGTFLLVTAWNNLDILADRFTGAPYLFISNFSVVNHYRRLAGGVLDLSSIAILLTYTLLGVFFTAVAIEFGRGRRL
jgi:ABC-2 type transport system permease protein